MQTDAEILAQSDTIYGFMRPEEAAFILKIAHEKCASGDLRDWVEVGSWCGRSTFLWATILKEMQSPMQLYAIDPHEGDLSKMAEGAGGRNRHEAILETPNTWVHFKGMIERFELQQQIVPMVQKSTDVVWSRSIGLCFIDGLHGYEFVSADYAHFAPHFTAETIVAFHDDDWEGVHQLIMEKVDAGELEILEQVASLVKTRFLKKHKE